MNHPENPGKLELRHATASSTESWPGTGSAAVELVRPSQTETLPAFLCPLLLGPRGTEAGGHAYVSREGGRDTPRSGPRIAGSSHGR